jgi:calcineurin-like phosphoesterase family protein
MPIDQQWVRKIYLEELSREVEWFDGITRSKARSPMKYEKIQSQYFKDGFQDLDKVPTEKIWFTSDQHYGHKNIIEFSKRPFVGVGHMNQAMVEWYNDTIEDDDVVIHVGDLAFGDEYFANNVLSHLKGYKILVVGNHDFMGKKLRRFEGYDEIHLCLGLERDKQKFVITHYPFEECPKGYRNIHGHTHAASFESYRGDTHFNVNVEFHSYKPIQLRKILDTSYQYMPVFEVDEETRKRSNNL